MTLSDAAKLRVESEGPDETISIGEQLAEKLQAGDVVAIYGELGSGKTQLVKGICRYFGIDEQSVSSPTFTIIHEYDGSLPVYHLDLYRIQRIEEVIDIGFSEYVYGDGICLIEWPDIVSSILPEHTLCLRISHLQGNRRLLVREKAILRNQPDD